MAGATTGATAAIGLGGIAAGEIPGVDVSPLNADLTIGAGIDFVEGFLGTVSFFFGCSERKTVFVLLAAASVPRFRAVALSFVTRAATARAASTTRFVADDNLAAAAFTPGDFAFDGATLFLSADDGTAEFFLDLPAFIGGPRDLRLQRP